MRKNNAPLFGPKDQSYNIFNQSRVAASPFGRPSRSPVTRDSHTPDNKKHSNLPLFSTPTPPKQETKSIFPAFNDSRPTGLIFGPSQTSNKSQTPPSFVGNLNPAQASNEQLKEELEKRDKRIDMLESQIKILNESMALAINFMSQHKCTTATNAQITHPRQSEIGSISTVLADQKPILPFGMLAFSSGSGSIYRDQNYSLYVHASTSHNSSPNVKIENEQGKIIFSEPLNLQSLQCGVSKWLRISNSNVEVRVQELRNKKCEIFLHDFMGYSQCKTAIEKQAIVDKLSAIRQDCQKFEAIDFDFETGLLYLKCRGL